MLNKSEFKHLFDTYFDPIRRFVFYRCGNAELASDVTQDVFMTVWEKRAHLQDVNLKGLLYKMAHERVISNHRREAVRNDFERSLFLPVEPDAALPEEELFFEETARRYAQALQQMPEAQRVVFLMSRNDELTYLDISERLDTSVKNVEKRMSAALQLLRTKLSSTEKHETGKE